MAYELNRQPAPSAVVSIGEIRQFNKRGGGYGYVREMTLEETGCDYPKRLAVTIFGDDVTLTQGLKPGDLVTFEGEVETSHVRYTGKDGKEREFDRTRVVARRVSKVEQDAPAAEPAADQPAYPESVPPADGVDEDIPF